MININNYFSQVSSIDFNALPDALKKGNEFVIKATQNGSSWASYESSETIKKTVDTYLSKLNEFVKASSKERKQIKEDVRFKEHKEVIDEALKRQGITKTAKNAKKTEEKQTTLVERIPEEIRFIKRYINLNGKTKSKEDILRFINALQKAILEKKIRKNSPYAKEIQHIQTKLLDTYNSMKNRIALQVSPKTLEDLKALAGGEKVYPSIQYLKKYINMNGKAGMKEKARKLLEQLKKAVDRKKITKDDTYAIILNKAYENLLSFTKNKSEKVLRIESRELNGIEGLLGCNCQNLNGFQAKPEIMNSMDFANLTFNTLGFTGKWYDLIGDPSSNFTAMVFGKPKMGKSYLCMEFAGYLARMHGNVLYVAKEEGLDMTLQKKLKDKSVAHPNLTVSSFQP